MLHLVSLALLTASLVTSSPLYKRQEQGYPAPDATGPAPRPEWIARLAEAKARGAIPDFAPAMQQEGSNPYYAEGVDTGPDGVCSWTVSNCENHGDLYDIIDAPTGMFGITHDDGPTPASPELYRFLESQGQASTHFLIGSNILNNPEEFQLLVDTKGHLAIHTWSHPYMTTMTDEQVLGELGWTAQIIYDRTGFVPAFWRPPYGDVDNRIRAIAREVFGLEHTVIWNSDTDDWCLSEGGGSSCGTNGPQTDADLDTYFDGILTGPKDPGLILLEHELNSRHVQAFTRNYGKIAANGWTARSIPDLWGVNWYLNAANADSTPMPGIGVGQGPVAAAPVQPSLSSLPIETSSGINSTAPAPAPPSTAIPSSVTSATSAPATPYSSNGNDGDDKPPLYTEIVTVTTRPAASAIQPSPTIVPVQAQHKSSASGTTVARSAVALVVVAISAILFA